MIIFVFNLDICLFPFSILHSTVQILSGGENYDKNLYCPLIYRSESTGTVRGCDITDQKKKQQNSRNIYSTIRPKTVLSVFGRRIFGSRARSIAFVTRSHFIRTIVEIIINCLKQAPKGKNSHSFTQHDSVRTSYKDIGIGQLQFKELDIVQKITTKMVKAIHFISVVVVVVSVAAIVFFSLQFWQVNEVYGAWRRNCKRYLNYVCLYVYLNFFSVFASSANCRGISQR